MRMTSALFALLSVAAAPAFADCTAPSDALVIPNGAEATKAEMIAAQTAVKALNEAVRAYTACLKQEEDAKVAAGGDRGKLHEGYVKLDNDEINRLQQVANKFNEELRAYKAKNAPPSQ